MGTTSLRVGRTGGRAQEQHLQQLAFLAHFSPRAADACVTCIHATPICIAQLSSQGRASQMFTVVRLKMKSTGRAFHRKSLMSLGWNQSVLPSDSRVRGWAGWLRAVQWQRRAETENKVSRMKVRWSDGSEGWQAQGRRRKATRSCTSRQKKWTAHRPEGRKEKGIWWLIQGYLVLSSNHLFEQEHVWCVCICDSLSVSGTRSRRW